MGQFAEMKIPLAHEIEKPSGGGNQDIDALLNLLPLGSVTDSAIDKPNPKTRMLGKLLQGLGNLVRQFTGGFENQGSQFSRFSEVLKDRKCKGGGFACAGLG